MNRITLSQIKLLMWSLAGTPTADERELIYEIIEFLEKLVDDPKTEVDREMELLDELIDRIFGSK